MDEFGLRDDGGAKLVEFEAEVEEGALEEIAAEVEEGALEGIAVL